MLTYSQVEATLAQIHFIDADAMGAFRGRIKHFQRIGIVPSSPGKGKRISYEIYDLLVWAYALELAEFGIDPTVIVAIIKTTMPYFIDLFEDVDKNEHDLLLCIYPNMLSSYVKQGIESVKKSTDSSPFALAKINIANATVLDIEKRMVPKLRIGLRPHSDEVFGRRIALMNITKLKRQIERALNEIDGVPKDLLKNIMFDRRPDYVGA